MDALRGLGLPVCITLIKRFVAAPEVRQVRPRQHQIARLEWLDVIAYESVPVAANDRRELVLRVIVPGSIEVRQAKASNQHRTLLGDGYFFK